MLTTGEIARLRGMKPLRVYRMAAQNLIPHLKVRTKSGRVRMYFDLDEFDAWRARNQAEGSRPVVPARSAKASDGISPAINDHFLR